MLDASLTRATWAEVLSEPPDLPPLELVLDGKTYRSRPRAQRGLDDGSLERIQAAWDAADRTDERDRIRRDRKRLKAREMRVRPADDSERRVRQRREDAQQQRTDRGALLSLLSPLSRPRLPVPPPCSV